MRGHTIGLGDALIRKARETGDPSYFNRAEEALKKSLDINPNNAGAMRHLAYVFYSRHEFEPAAVHARKAIEMDSTDGDSYGILGDALMETGEYEKAEERLPENDAAGRKFVLLQPASGIEERARGYGGAQWLISNALLLQAKRQNNRQKVSPGRSGNLAAIILLLENWKKQRRFYRQSLEPLIPIIIAHWREWRRFARRRRDYDEAIRSLPESDQYSANARYIRGGFRRHL